MQADQRCKQIITTMFFLILICMLTGCESAMSEFAEPVEVCTLLKSAEVGAVLGATVEEPPRAMERIDEKSGYWSSMCNYYAPDPGISVSIMIRPILDKTAGPVRGYAAYIKEMQTIIPDYTLKEVAYLDEVAGYDVDMHQLVVFTNTHVLHITGLDSGKKIEVNLETSKRLANEVLERIR